MATTITQTPVHSRWDFKRDWTYLVPMGLLSLMMLTLAVLYFAKAEFITAAFVKVGFPTWIRPLLGPAKVIGLGLIWFSPSAPLRLFAYAGFLFNFVLAALAHGFAGDLNFGPQIVALILLGIAMWRDPRP